MKFDRHIYFESVRKSMFSGSMTQQQVDGQNFKLAAYENNPLSSDLRHLAYPFATSYHETASTMWPIEEFGKGKGKPYGRKDRETGQIYYGRGDVQLTWKDNYRLATEKLELTGGTDDLEWHAARALDPTISANVMYKGMEEGWFRGDRKGRHTLDRYFGPQVDDPVGARNIINGDVKSVGKAIAGYHQKFLEALIVSEIGRGLTTIVYRVTVTVPEGTPVEIKVEKDT